MMKKLIPALLIFVFSLLAMNHAQASTATTVVKKSVPAEQTAVKAKPVFGGYWLAVCVYNPETDTYDFILIWVEDSKS